MSSLIYVADDEENIRNMIKSFLEEENFTVEVFENGKLLIDRFNEKIPDLVILDVMMPVKDGFTAIMEIRKTSDIPIILLTARDTDADYVTGFTTGCDDYFTKPFSPVKLVMKVKVILNSLKKSSSTKNEVSFGDITIFPDKKTSYCKKEILNLTATEYALLLYIMENSDRAISREELLDKVWGYEGYVETRATDDTVKRLRKKLLKMDSKVSIDTV